MRRDALDRYLMLLVCVQGLCIDGLGLFPEPTCREFQYLDDVLKHGHTYEPLIEHRDVGVIERLQSQTSQGIMGVCLATRVRQAMQELRIPRADRIECEGRQYSGSHILIRYDDTMIQFMTMNMVVTIDN